MNRNETVEELERLITGARGILDNVLGNELGNGIEDDGTTAALYAALELLTSAVQIVPRMESRTAPGASGEVSGSNSTATVNGTVPDQIDRWLMGAASDLCTVRNMSGDGIAHASSEPNLVADVLVGIEALVTRAGRAIDQCRTNLGLRPPVSDWHDYSPSSAAS